MLNSNLLKVFLDQRSVCTDTRKISAGDLFFALKGPNFNGNRYAAKALEAGASLVVVDEKEHCPEGDNRYILVDNVLLALQNLATEYRQRFSIPVIGITGTNGKTTTKELMNAVLSEEKNVHATTGNLNNHIGVPLTILAMPEDTEVAIIEMGANKSGDIAELCCIAQPTHGIISNIGFAHLELFGSIEVIAQTKGELFESIRKVNGLAWVNEKDVRILKLAGKLEQQFTYGGKNSRLTILDVGYQLDGQKLKITDRKEGVEFVLHSGIPGKHNTENILAACAVGIQLGISIEGIQKGIKNYKPDNNRTELIRTNEFTILMDAYNANPSSMYASIESFFETSGESVALILGEMFELGNESKKSHRELGEFLVNYPIEKLITIGSDIEATYEASGKSGKHFSDTNEALPFIRKEMEGIKFILVKGSRGVALEKLLPEITAE